MSKHVLILGAGFGGLELATRLSETIADAVRLPDPVVVAVGSDNVSAADTSDGA